MAQEFGRRQYPPREAAQPDPMLTGGQVSGGWKWAIAAAIAVILVLTMYGMTRDWGGQQHAAAPPAASAPPTSGNTPVELPATARKPGG